VMVYSYSHQVHEWGNLKSNSEASVHPPLRMHS
jgi:hypothetical protein